jgi:long-chain fatty acid transport protein
LNDNTVGSGNDWSEGNYFLAPNMGYVSEDWGPLKLGFAMYGNGLATDFDENMFTLNNPAFDGNPNVGVGLVQVSMAMTGAFKLTDSQSVGVSVIPILQGFRARGLQSFASPVYSSNPEYVTDNGSDYEWGFGGRVGWLGRFLEDKLSFGIAYSTEGRMEEFNRYIGLFAEQGDFDVPATLGAGMAIQMTDALLVALDIGKIYYSDVASVGNRGPVPNGNLPLGDQNLGLDSGAGFGWRDQLVYKIGFDYNLAGYHLRAGWNYGARPFPDDQLTFNLLAPAVVENHLTLGFGTELDGWKLFGWSKKASINATYVHAFRELVTGPSLAGTLEMEMYQHVFDFQYSLNW